MTLAVVCPTRGRAESCGRMVRSVLDTSAAHVLLYADCDDPAAHEVIHFASPRVHVRVEQPIGRGAAVNALCDRFRDYDAYLIVSDDIEFVRSGWDGELLVALAAFGDGIGVAHLAGSNVVYPDGEPWVNWACVSRRWIDTLGWLNYPECRWFCQDTILQALAESIDRITRIDQVALHHECERHDDVKGHMAHDAEKFLWFFAQHFRECRAKLLAEIAKGA